MVMGVAPEELAKHYPRLYHMAHRESWMGIQRHGLLCTKALLDLFEVSPEKRDLVLNQQRRQSIPIEHADRGKAVIRDQKPLIRSRLEPSLRDCSFQQWLDMLNSRVFFWLTEARLKTLMCAKEYCADQHVVLVLDTARLAEDFQDRISLAAMNTGSTRPMAFERGLSTFSRMASYPFEERHRKHLELVMEFAVEDGVPNIMNYLVQAAEMRCSTCDRKKNQSIRKVKKLYPEA